ncbi:hypothetical protein CH275_10140 [Rhodococcus sp. 06-235-1A]|nr:hypothetical protein CH275_10140 [Rhodococcus sp. 06-235-1A]
MRIARVLIGAMCWMYGLVCVSVLSAGDLATTTLGRIVVVMAAASTLAVGALWVRGPWPAWALSVAFIVYADVGVAAVLLALVEDPVKVLPCSALLGVVGSYIAAFHGPKALLIHQVWAFAVSLRLYLAALFTAPEDTAHANAYFVVVLLVLFAAPVLTQTLILLLRRDATNAFYDSLTGLRNRRGLFTAIESSTGGLYFGIEDGVVVTESAILTAVMIDLDDFKEINDRHGHGHGDEVIRLTAERIASVFPAPAVTARLGGEEFAAVFVMTRGASVSAAERLCEVVRQASVRTPISVSVGVAHLGRSPDPNNRQSAVNALLARADAAMYEAKRRGKNQVVVY